MMKHFITLAGLAALISAQTVDDLPPCSVQCLQNGMKLAGCAIDDIKCACAKVDSISDDISPCLETACDSGDMDIFRDLVIQACKNAGVPIVPDDSDGEIVLLDGMKLS
jgi:hypothetical protein